MDIVKGHYIGTMQTNHMDIVKGHYVGTTADIPYGQDPVQTK